MLNLLVVVDFRFISAFLYVHWAVNSHVRRLLNFYHLRFPEFDWSFKDFQSDQMQSTLALGTPRFLGHPAMADKSHPPPPPAKCIKKWLKQTPTIMEMRTLSCPQVWHSCKELSKLQCLSYPAIMDCHYYGH